MPKSYINTRILTNTYNSIKQVHVTVATRSQAPLNLYGIVHVSVSVNRHEKPGSSLLEAFCMDVP